MKNYTVLKHLMFAETPPPWPLYLFESNLNDFLLKILNPNNNANMILHELQETQDLIGKI